MTSVASSQVSAGTLLPSTAEAPPGSTAPKPNPAPMSRIVAFTGGAMTQAEVQAARQALEKLLDGSAEPAQAKKLLDWIKTPSGKAAFGPVVGALKWGSVLGGPLLLGGSADQNLQQRPYVEAQAGQGNLRTLLDFMVERADPKALVSLFAGENKTQRALQNLRTLVFELLGDGQLAQARQLLGPLATQMQSDGLLGPQWSADEWAGRMTRRFEPPPAEPAMAPGDSAKAPVRRVPETVAQRAGAVVSQLASAIRDVNAEPTAQRREALQQRLDGATELFQQTGPRWGASARNGYLAYREQAERALGQPTSEQRAVQAVATLAQSIREYNAEPTAPQRAALNDALAETAALHRRNSGHWPQAALDNFASLRPQAERALGQPVPVRAHPADGSAGTTTPTPPDENGKQLLPKDIAHQGENLLKRDSDNPIRKAEQAVRNATTAEELEAALNLLAELAPERLLELLDDRNFSSMLDDKIEKMLPAQRATAEQARRDAAAAAQATLSADADMFDAPGAVSSDATSKWGDHFAQTADGRARQPLQRAIDEVAAGHGESPTALDLGSGAGVATRKLLDDGFQVTAIDADPAARAYADRAFDNRADRGEFRQESLTDASLPPSDLVWSGLTLPYLDSDSFAKSWSNIDAAVKPGGVFAGDFFGLNHAYNTGPDSGKTFLDRAQVEALFEDYDILQLAELDTNAKTISGNDQRFHVYTVVARKNPGVVEGDGDTFVEADAPQTRRADGTPSSSAHAPALGNMSHAGGAAPLRATLRSGTPPASDAADISGDAVSSAASIHRDRAANAPGKEVALLQPARYAIARGDTSGLSRIIDALEQQIVQLQSSGQQDRAAACLVVAKGLREDLRRLQSSSSPAREHVDVNPRLGLQSQRDTPDIQYSLDRTFLDPKKTAAFQKRMQAVLGDNFGQGGASASLRVVGQSKMQPPVDKTLHELMPKVQGNLGRLTLQDFLDLAPNGAIVDLSVTRNGKSVQVEIKHPAFDALHFWLGESPSGNASSAVEDLVVMPNRERWRSRAPPGLASVFTLRLVERLTQLGVESLLSSAAGRGKVNFDGNHVWPLLGFDGPVSGSMRQRMLEPDNAARLSNAGIDVHNIARLSELVFNADGSYNAEGVKFLKRNRESLDIDVDLTDPTQLGRLRATLERFGLSSLIHR